MAHRINQITIPAVAASAFGFGVILEGVTDADEKVRAASGITGGQIIGFSIASVGTYGAPAAVAIDGSVVKAIVAASIGAFSRVSVGSTNGAVGPVTASGVASGPSAMQLARFSAGVALKSGISGDVIPVLVRIEEVI